jgi:hypothetical protein
VDTTEITVHLKVDTTGINLVCRLLRAAAEEARMPDNLQLDDERDPLVEDDEVIDAADEDEEDEDEEDEDDEDDEEEDIEARHARTA